MEGIRLLKERQGYRGRKIGTTVSPMDFLRKPKSVKILDYLQKGYTVREIGSILKVSPSTVLKVKKLSGQCMTETP